MYAVESYRERWTVPYKDGVCLLSLPQCDTLSCKDLSLRKARVQLRICLPLQMALDSHNNAFTFSETGGGLAELPNRFPGHKTALSFGTRDKVDEAAKQRT